MYKDLCIFYAKHMAGFAVYIVYILCKAYGKQLNLKNVW